jgi:hypothetical protein
MIPTAAPRSQPPNWIYLGFILLIAGLFAYNHRFIQDDAYISFQYAKHFALGQGLVWYPGSTEFGYTSFLFTVGVGLLMKLGIAEEAAALAISVPAFFGAIATTFAIARRLSFSTVAPILAVVALATHPTFTAYATGGLETSLQTFLVLATYYEYVRWMQSGDRWPIRWLGTFAAFALLTRLDSALLLLPVYVGLGVSVLRRRDYASLGLWLEGVWQPLIAVGGLLAFDTVYYGQPFPTTFYAKVDGGWHWQGGIAYLASYARSRALLPVGAMMLLLGTAIRRHGHLAYALLWLCPILIWLAYIIKIGGDFMEFRLLVPILPFCYLLAASLLGPLTTFRARWTAVLMGVVILAGNIIQRTYFVDGIDVNMIESTVHLNSWVKGEPANWSEVGKVLRRLFFTGASSDVKIAVTAAGAIPYYSDLPAVDMHGLNTRGVLVHGSHHMDRPGHRIQATLPWMQEQGVNLVIGHPSFVSLSPGQHAPPQATASYFSSRPPFLVLIPVNPRRCVVATYLNRHETVEARLREGSIFRYPVDGAGNEHAGVNIVAQ